MKHNISATQGNARRGARVSTPAFGTKAAADRRGDRDRISVVGKLNRSQARLPAPRPKRLVAVAYCPNPCLILPMLWQKMTLVGIGLLGGSLGLAARQRRLVGRIEGYVRRTASVTECEQLGIVERATLDLDAAVADADFVVLCTPLAQMRGLAERMAPSLKRGAVVTDVGSVKGSVVDQLEALLAEAGAHFIGSHPMAGAEKMGAAAARPDLFHNAVVAITPTERSHADALRRVEEFWRALGTRTLQLPPELHDEMVARCSHLPHLVAAELSNLVLDPAHPKEQAALCANGFRDTTRIASGSPEMWRDIALANRRNLSRVISHFIDDLHALQRAIDGEDAQALDEFLSKAKQRRDQWRSQNASPSPE